MNVQKLPNINCVHQVFASDPWHLAQPGSIRNLTIQTKGTGKVVRNNIIWYNHIKLCKHTWVGLVCLAWFVPEVKKTIFGSVFTILILILISEYELKLHKCRGHCRDQFPDYRVECDADYEGEAKQKDRGAQKGGQCCSFKRSVMLVHAKVNLAWKA